MFYAQRNILHWNQFSRTISNGQYLSCFPLAIQHRTVFELAQTTIFKIPKEVTGMDYVRYFSSRRSIDYMPWQNICISFRCYVIAFRSKGSYIFIVLIMVSKILKKCLNNFSHKNRASFREADIWWPNINDSRACKMNHFVWNKSKLIKALADEKRKIGQVHFKSSVNLILMV